jgi:hypothetical protein
METLLQVWFELLVASVQATRDRDREVAYSNCKFMNAIFSTTAKVDSSIRSDLSLLRCDNLWHITLPVY